VQCPLPNWKHEACITSSCVEKQIMGYRQMGTPSGLGGPGLGISIEALSTCLRGDAGPVIGPK